MGRDFGILNLTNQEFIKELKEESFKSFKEKYEWIVNFDSNKEENSDKMFKYFEESMWNDIDWLIRYILGEVNNFSEEEKLKETYISLETIKGEVWRNTYLNNNYNNINWDKWEETKLGYIVKIAELKFKLDKNEDLTAPEVAKLANSSIKRVVNLIQNPKNNYKGDKREINSQKVWFMKSKSIKKFLPKFLPEIWA